MTANLKTQIDLEKMAGETQIEQQGGITPTFVFHNGVIENRKLLYSI